MQANAAYTRLREAIVDGQYSAGSRLTEVELADTLGMSRTPVREALRRLAGDGLVRASDRGVIVDLMDDAEARHARAVRAALDVLVTELAARRQKAGEISPAALRAAEEAAADAEAAHRHGDADAAYQHDQRLHRQIAEMAGNPVALQMLDRLADRLEVARLAADSRAARAASGENVVKLVPVGAGLVVANGTNGVHLEAVPDDVTSVASAYEEEHAAPVLSPDLVEEHRRLLAAIAAGQPAAAWLAAREHAHG
ncbi:GntR family transcriptional regulator [Cryptosporangium phraense]|uniref:GntR family transcriptional regulator n=1 Tax=Cryptosporangium phraense TaxID=2593070 RepID=UPI00197A8BEB|nr:GntR family transcriptional regulator [Cryptosporangium phraense]